MYRIYLIAMLFVAPQINSAQNEEIQKSDVEIFIIDSYVTPESPYKVKITFFTSDSVTSCIVFSENQFFSVSSEPSDEHKFELSLDSLNADSSIIPYKVVIKDNRGWQNESEIYDLFLPEEFELQFKDQSNFWDICMGGVYFWVPFPAYVFNGDDGSFSITKELPIISFYGKGYNYPTGYISLEYSYIFEAEKRNYLRLGYKQIFQVDLLEYIAPGLNLTTNFSGFNGISPEITLGLFEFYDSFTFFVRYRYNFDPSESFTDFHDISIGLFTSTISFNL